MNLVLAANDIAAELSHKIRSRIAAGAPVWEPAPVDVPSWFVSEVNGSPVHAVFQSIHAFVAVLADGNQVVRSAPRA